MTERMDTGNGHHRRRRGPRLGDSRAPVTTIVVILAAAAAVIAGFVILRSVTDPDTGPADATGGAATSVSPAPESTVSATSVTTSTLPSTSTSTSTTTTLPRASKSDAVVLVANASGVDRSATAMTEELAADGYTTSASVANATGPHLERSIIYYLEGDVGAQGVANLLAEQIPTARALPMPDVPPLDRPLNDATVALLLGTDAAGRSLADLATD
jgi:cytoskeletal protein RodZ